MGYIQIFLFNLPRICKCFQKVNFSISKYFVCYNKVFLIYIIDYCMSSGFYLQNPHRFLSFLSLSFSSLDSLFLHSKIFITFFFPFQDHSCGIWKFPDQGSNGSCNCWPMPQLQQCQILATSATQTAAGSNAGYLTH